MTRVHTLAFVFGGIAIGCGLFGPPKHDADAVAKVGAEWRARCNGVVDACIAKNDRKCPQLDECHALERAALERLKAENAAATDH